MRLKELRKERKLNQQAVADALNCSQSVYSRYENGSYEPPIDVLIRLADFYGVTLDELVGRTPIPVIITKEATPAEPPQGMKRLTLDFGSSTTEPADVEPDTFEQRVAEILEKELKKRGL